MQIRSVYFPTVEATVNAAFDQGSGSYREPDALLEVPADEYLLTAGEIDRFAARIKSLVDAAWLRRMFKIDRDAAKSGDWSGIKASRRFADRELDKVCREVVGGRAPIVLPSPSAVNTLLEEIGLLESSAEHKR